jgi:hypothetical protein
MWSGKESQGVLTYEAQTGRGCVGCIGFLPDVTLMKKDPFYLVSITNTPYMSLT